jgi:2-keto-myo-inositol isomerase
LKISFNEACKLRNSTLEQDLVLCEKAGFDYIELRIDKLREYLGTHSIDELKGFFAKNHIKPFSLNGIYVYTDFLSNKDDPSRSKALLEDISFGCEICSAISSREIVMVPPLFSEDENKDYEDPWDKIVEDNVRIYTAMSDFVAQYGMNIGIEIVGARRCSIRTIEQCNVVVDAVDKLNVGYTIDAFNLYLSDKSNNFESIQKAHPEKIFVVHINGAEEGSLKDLRQSYRTFADRGVMDVKNYLENLKKVGYDGPVSIEFFREDCWKCSAESVINKAYETTKKAMKECNVLK